MNSIELYLSDNPRLASSSLAGFTAVELAAVIAMLGLLASVMVTSLAGTRADIAAVQCRHNLRQLTLAWTMYIADNGGRLVPNHDGDTAGRTAGMESWVAGWLDVSGSSDNTNVQMLIDHFQFPFGAYLGPYLKSPVPFKCPADKSEVTIANVRMPRVRSIS